MGAVCERRNRSPAEQGFDFADDAFECKGTWCKENCVAFCQEGEEDLFRGKMRLLGGDIATTRAAIQALNTDRISCPEGFCIAHSRSEGQYYLLHTDPGKAGALEALGFTEEDFVKRWRMNQAALASRSGNIALLLDKRPGEQFGLRLTGSSGKGEIAVQGITAGGLVEQWNVANPTQALQPEDIIIQVNGISGDVGPMLEELKMEEGSFVLVLRRHGVSVEESHNNAAPVETNNPKEATDSPAVAAGEPGSVPAQYEYEVTVDKTGGQPLGLKLVKDDQDNLIVHSITDGQGLARQWNDAHPAEAMQAGDIIVSANGLTGDPLTIAAECKQDKVVLLRLRRP